jgi:hypothetical protein
MFAYTLSASPLDSIGSYEGFIVKKEMWICNSIAFPVDISYDAFKIDFKTVAQGGHGYFIQVKPGSHMDGRVMPDADDIIQNPSKGVLNVVGKPAGVYEYIFVSTDDNFCGMTNGEQSVVRVYIAPQLIGFPVLTNVCPGTEVSIDLDEFIPPEIKYFLDEMGWTLTYIRDGEKVEMPVIAGKTTVGDNVYEYTINDNSGEFKGKYSAMQNSVYFCPHDTAKLTHTVRIREGGEYVIPSKNISFCSDVLHLASETSKSLTVNLFGYLGASAVDGKWSVVLTKEELEPYVEVDEQSGLANIKDYSVFEFIGESVVFKYSYNNCIDDTFTLLTLDFKSEVFKDVFINPEEEYEICRNLVSGVVDLSSVFGFSVPLTSGIWYGQNQETKDLTEEMLYGAVDISELKSGSLHKFRYEISPAVDAICLMEGQQTIFNLRIHDLEVANSEIKVCKAQFASGVVVNLSQYVPGLNDTSRIKPGNITWRDNNGAEISNPETYRLRATNESQTNEAANFRMVYTYEVDSPCGQYTGKLYISAIDGLGSDTLRTIQVCYTDDYAKHIDLFQVLGIVGANGHFIVYDVPVKTGAKLDSLNRIETTGVMNAYELFDTSKESETYKFRYLPSNNDPCVSDKVEITIIVTKETGNDPEYEIYPK